MLFVVLFEDNPDADADIRTRLMPDHLAFLKSHADTVRAAGPMKDREDDPAGGLWLVNGESADKIDELVKTDPFWPTGLRKSYQVLSWTQVFTAE